jgi:uncharacterized protein (DUF58 family)
VSPSERAAAVVGAVALTALVLPLELAALALVAVAAATAVDAVLARRMPELRRSLSPLLARGVPSALRLEPAEPPGALRLRLRQPLPPDMSLEPSEADHRVDGVLVPHRRGRHVLPAAAVRADGPLRLGSAYARRLGEEELRVYPDLPAARRLALAVRRGSLRDLGRQGRGPLGLGTELESVRDYLPDDDLRQVNWAATARLGRPMSNQYRVEHDREVTCLVDAGRLMAAPLGNRTRLDAALDAVAAVAAVADEVGDRCGAVAFDAALRRTIRPRRLGGRAVVESLFDLEPSRRDSDYELAFAAVGRGRRGLVLVFTDLLDEAAARSLLAGAPVLARRHAVLVATAADADLLNAVAAVPTSARDVYAAAAALDVLAARERVAARLRRSGAGVVEARPEELGAACVRAYLRAKARARL